jgi:hypothetical protein
LVTVVPIDLGSLRSATAVYVAILYDSLPTVEALAESEPEAGPMARLRDSVEAALDIDDAPGTPAAILSALCRLLGTLPPAEGAPGASRGPFASMMPVHLCNGTADERDVERDHWRRKHGGSSLEA